MYNLLDDMLAHLRMITFEQPMHISITMFSDRASERSELLGSLGASWSLLELLGASWSGNSFRATPHADSASPRLPARPRLPGPSRPDRLGGPGRPDRPPGRPAGPPGRPRQLFQAGLSRASSQARPPRPGRPGRPDRFPGRPDGPARQPAFHVLTSFSSKWWPKL